MTLILSETLTTLTLKLQAPRSPSGRCLFGFGLASNSHMSLAIEACFKEKPLHTTSQNHAYKVFLSAQGKGYRVLTPLG